MNKHTSIKTTELAKLSTSLIARKEAELTKIEEDLDRLHQEREQLWFRKCQLMNERSAIYAMDNMVGNSAGKPVEEKSAVDDLEKQIESLAEKPNNEVKSEG